MKTKLTLFVAVLAAALFGMGCASTKETLLEPVVNQANLESKNGLIVLKGKQQPFTGTVREYVLGKLNFEYQVKAGLNHGYWKSWWVRDQSDGGLSGHDKYENGKITYSKRWHDSGVQIPIGGFNLDGSRRR